MSNLTRFKIWKVIFASNHFWMATLVTYFTRQGVSLDQVYLLLGLYSLFVVLFEFPTGVIGDYFSHKSSVFIGNILWTLMFLLLVSAGTVTYYIAVLSVAALGITLISGSDNAMLFSLSKDYKKDLAQITPYAIFLSVITVALGGVLASFNMTYPLYASFLYSCSGVLLLTSVKYKQEVKKDANIFSSAYGGLLEVLRASRLKNLIFVSALWGSFFLSLKWFYNPLFEEINLDIIYWGVVIAVFNLSKILGVKIYERSKGISLSILILTLSICTVGIGITNNFLVPLIAIFMVRVLQGVFDTKMEVEINNEISSHRRATILSLNSLLTRSFSSVLILGSGLLISQFSFLGLMSLIVGLFAVVLILPLKKLSS